MNGICKEGSHTFHSFFHRVDLRLCLCNPCDPNVSEILYITHAGVHGHLSVIDRNWEEGPIYADLQWWVLL
jgi:hypothetical protein